MPDIRSALEHGICSKTASAPIFGGIIMCQNTVFLNGIRRDSGCRAARAYQSNAAPPLLIVVDAFHHIVAGARARTIYGCAARGAVVRGCAGDEINKCVLAAGFQWRALPYLGIHQLRYQI